MLMSMIVGGQGYEDRAQARRSEAARKASMARHGRNRSRRTGSPLTSEIEYKPDELEFMAAIEAWKNATGRKFPTWREVLRVVKSLGYARDHNSA
jgi:hypothetical protein